MQSFSLEIIGIHLLTCRGHRKVFPNQAGLMCTLVSHISINRFWITGLFPCTNPPDFAVVPTLFALFSRHKMTESSAIGTALTTNSVDLFWICIIKIDLGDFWICLLHDELREWQEPNFHCSDARMHVNCLPTYGFITPFSMATRSLYL